MDRRVLGVGLAGLLVGGLAGALALLEGPGPVDHTRMFQPLPTAQERASRPSSRGGSASSPARPERPGPPTPPEGREPGGPQAGPPRGPPGEGEAGEVDRSRDVPYRMPPEPDTGMPPPGAMLGLPDAEVDDATLIGELAAEPFPLPERPLSDVELGALEERAAWVSEACAAAPSAGCGQAQANMEAALATARQVRDEADLPAPDPDAGPEKRHEVAPPKGPPPAGGPPHPPDEPPPPDGPPPDEDRR